MKTLGVEETPMKPLLGNGETPETNRKSPTSKDRSIEGVGMQINFRSRLRINTPGRRPRSHNI